MGTEEAWDQGQWKANQALPAPLFLSLLGGFLFRLITPANMLELSSTSLFLDYPPHHLLSLRLGSMHGRDLACLYVPQEPLLLLKLHHPFPVPHPHSSSDAFSRKRQPHVHSREDWSPIEVSPTGLTLFRLNPLPKGVSGPPLPTRAAPLPEAPVSLFATCLTTPHSLAAACTSLTQVSLSKMQTTGTHKTH